jgi:uncharacterized protein with FMN-binding domain
MRTSLAAAVSAVAVASPIANAAAAATPAKHLVSTMKTVSGMQVEADRWGYVQVTLVVKKTTTTIGTKKTVSRKLVKVNVPVYPNHTDRSIYINEQAIPLLVQEALAAKFTGNVDLVSGATDTSYAFAKSLQAALLAAKKV